MPVLDYTNFSFKKIVCYFIVWCQSEIKNFVRKNRTKIGRVLFASNI